MLHVWSFLNIYKYYLMLYNRNNIMLYVNYTLIEKKRVDEHAVTIVLARLIFLRHTKADLISIQTSDINFIVRNMQM